MFRPEHHEHLTTGTAPRDWDPMSPLCWDLRPSPRRPSDRTESQLTLRSCGGADARASGTGPAPLVIGEATCRSASFVGAAVGWERLTKQSQLTPVVAGDGGAACG